MFIIRDMALGGLLGEPFTGEVRWNGYPNEVCQTATKHGLEYRPGSVLLQKVYEIEDILVGEGSVVVYGAPSYDEVNDKVVRTVTRSKSAQDLLNDAEAARQAAISSDALCSNILTQLKTATNEQIKTYVNNNVTDLASAKMMLQRIALALATLARQLP